MVLSWHIFVCDASLQIWGLCEAAMWALVLPANCPRNVVLLEASSRWEQALGKSFLSWHSFLCRASTKAFPFRFPLQEGEKVALRRNVQHPGVLQQERDPSSASLPAHYSMQAAHQYGLPGNESAIHSKKRGTKPHKYCACVYSLTGYKRNGNASHLPSKLPLAVRRKKSNKSSCLCCYSLVFHPWCPAVLSFSQR